MARKKSEHYVNNKMFFEALVEYKAKVIDAKKKEELRPQPSTYLGSCIMKIATHLSHKPNFTNYTFKEEMISDGIENSLQYIDNFNPEKSQNPFAYFTQIIYYAFLRRIEKEKKQLYTKYKMTDQVNINQTASVSQIHTGLTWGQDNYGGANLGSEVKYNEWTQEKVSHFIDDFEVKKRRKVQKRTADTTVIFTD
tara:strand:- start:19687 stop:20271 length:585 start_codon:yes stop_codon:yes gene_type:complete